MEKECCPLAGCVPAPAPAPSPLSCPYQFPEDSALLVIDMQNDFVSQSQGSLPVTDGDTIIPLINNLSSCSWKAIAYTQDFHPFNHASFASTSVENVGVFGFENLTYGGVADETPFLCGQKYVDANTWGASANATCKDSTVLEAQLWPDHCVQGTWGQELDERIVVRTGATTVKKGFSAVVDSYGVFHNNLGISESNLKEIFTGLGVKEVYVVGLAYDYCVKNSALQSAASFKTTVLLDGTKAVVPSAIPSVTAELQAAGVTVGNSTTLLA